jgi:hypothetical protein
MLCLKDYRWIDIFVTSIGLSPGGSSTVHIHTKQYTENHNNTEETVRNIKGDKNTTEIQSTPVKSYFNLSKMYQKRICLTQNAQPYKC